MAIEKQRKSGLGHECVYLLKRFLKDQSKPVGQTSTRPSSLSSQQLTMSKVPPGITAGFGTISVEAVPSRADGQAAPPTASPVIRDYASTISTPHSAKAEALPLCLSSGDTRLRTSQCPPWGFTISWTEAVLLQEGLKIN